MDRKANIIKHLKMMGYTVTEVGEIVSVSLPTVHKKFSVRLRNEVFNKDCILEEIVYSINDLVKKEFLMR